MKITIEIPNEEITEAVFEKLTNRIAAEIFTERWTNDGTTFRRILKECTREMLKDHADEIVDRCVPQAANYIGKKGVAKLAETLAKPSL